MRRLSYFIIALLAIPAAASAQTLKSQSGIFDTKFHTLKVGAGGYVTGLNIARDGTKVVRTDTYGAYLFNKSAPNPGNGGGTGAWQQLVTINSMPPADARFGHHAGVYEIAIAPSDSARNLYVRQWVCLQVNKQGADIHSYGFFQSAYRYVRRRPNFWPLYGGRSHQCRCALCRNADKRSVCHDEWRSNFLTYN